MAENGLSDLFEYGQDFMIGNALGDGSEKKNKTEEKVEKTFQEKYREELKKDADSLGIDDDFGPDAVDEDATETGGDDTSAGGDEAKEGDVNAEEVEITGDEDEFVSSSDMFDEMK